jgi:acyl transferase domain-containing protein/3-hydroxymyristoyl/3-hydroxydecanoyl-(acyl carrier protein) dehydratase
MTSMATFEPIAIVGRGCVLPGATSPAELWNAIEQGRDLISQTPAGRWRLDPTRLIRSQPDPLFGAHTLHDRGGYVVDNIVLPDGLADKAAATGMSDPMLSWLLHCGRAALDEAQLTMPPPRSGIIVGNLSYPSSGCSTFVEGVLTDIVQGDARDRFCSGLPILLAARALGLDGTAFALDAACASSLYAIKLACDLLQDGEADLMLAGGISRADDLFIHLGFTALQALSPTGRAHPFGQAADGLMPAEGAGLVALKRLDDSERDGNCILGVIRGIGLSNDGRQKSFLAPDSDGQLRAMRAAYTMSDIDPTEIGYVECHATGTPRGDAVELESLTALFNIGRKPTLGSIKANLGHAMAAAGVTGLLRVLGALENGILPPTMQHGANIPLLATHGFHMPAEAEIWPKDTPRRAAISSFGFGGNNAHMIIEAWQPGAKVMITDLPSSTIGQDIAICAMGIVTGAAQNLAEFGVQWFAPPQEPAPPLQTVDLPLDGLGFPPNDMQACLGQQSALLQAADEALHQMTRLPTERTGVFVGMGCDTNSVRHRLRLHPDISAAWLTANAQSAPVLSAAHVLGAMPNLPANRLHAQRNWNGFGFTISSEECSGLDALNVAIRALRRGELDAALVGAVDLSHEAAHCAAANLLLPEDRRQPGDAAIALVLKRRIDAERDGDNVIALLSAEVKPESDIAHDYLRLIPSAGISPVTQRFGHSHAASGLLHFAAAVLSVAAKAKVDERGAWPWLTIAECRVTIEVEGMAGRRATQTVLAMPKGLPPVFAVDAPIVACYAAKDKIELIQMLNEDCQGNTGVWRIALTAQTTTGMEQQRRVASTALENGTLPSGPGRFYGTGAMVGEMSFTFTGAAASYDGMGREMLLAWPETGEALCRRCSYTETFASRLYQTGEERMDPWVQLGGGVLVALAQGEFSRGILNLKPTAAIGLSSGETNALLTFGVWRDLDAMLAAIEKSDLYAHQLTGTFLAATEYWQLPASEKIDWRNYRLTAPVLSVEAAVAEEEYAYITIIQGPDDCVIGGEAEACKRIIAKVAPLNNIPLGLDMVVHCPVLTPFAKAWYAIHDRHVYPAPGVRFYSHADHRAYEVTRASAADALTRQASACIDFRAVIEAAWADGVRVFVEHGPRNVLTTSVSRILGDRSHLAVALDRRDLRPLHSLIETTLTLWSIGASCEMTAFLKHLSIIRGSRRKLAQPGRMLRLTAHPPDLQEVVSTSTHLLSPQILSPKATIPMPAQNAPTETLSYHIMQPAPCELPVLTGISHACLGAASPSESDVQIVSPSALTMLFREIVATHHAHLSQQTEVQAAFLSLRQLTRKQKDVGIEMPTTSSESIAIPEPLPIPIPIPITIVPIQMPVTEQSLDTAPMLTRAQLEYISSGRIADVLGPLFAEQAIYDRQVRMPAPPLLLADRVISIDGEAGTMGTGRIMTETDIVNDAWYMHNGRMAPGALIESGQADLLLISWLGIDKLNKGERVYRLLGCELTFHGPLPIAGETLRYDICIDGHAKTGDVRLFFFHYDCWVRSNGTERKLLSVRHGQAGFFTDAELATSGGVLWDAAQDKPGSRTRYDQPPCPSARRRFEQIDLDLLTAGDAFGCFGPGFELTAPHQRTPGLPSGRLRLIDSVPEFDPNGGPWKRGYLRAQADVPVDAWFYSGHFHNDPCMPGTLMAEAASQALAFAMTALGFTIIRDSWRFEPVPEVAQTFVCRGQVIPDHPHRLDYEIFIEEIIDGPIPEIYAALLCHCDGQKVFHCRRFGLKLVPDWPLAQRPEMIPKSTPRLVGPSGDVRGDEYALMACAWGAPSEAFGTLFKPFDGSRRGPRLPGPPYHFLTRIRSVDSVPGEPTDGATVVAEYDVPTDAWYFGDGRGAVMPFAVLIEVALQPCGWLSSYMGFAVEGTGDVLFRNLDGNNVRTYGTITPTTGMLIITARLDRFARAGGSTIVFFTVEVRDANQPVMTFDTAFGFFTPQALASQAGLSLSKEQRAVLHAISDTPIQQFDVLAQGQGCSLAQGKIRMVETITGYWPNGGKAGLGRIRGQQHIDPRAWYFAAHFFQDSVQPGSLGLESLIQLLQAFVRLHGLGTDIQQSYFESAANTRPLTWRFRGQVVPTHGVATTILDITEITTHLDGSILIVADGSFWADDLPIYSLDGLSLQIVSRLSNDV